MTLELTTERPCVELTLDGRSAKLPVTLTYLEMASMAPVSEGGERAFVEWFVGFARSYVGDAVDSLGDDSLGALMREWSRLRREIGEPEPGES